MMRDGFLEFTSGTFTASPAFVFTERRKRFADLRERFGATKLWAFQSCLPVPRPKKSQTIVIACQFAFEWGYFRAIAIGVSRFRRDHPNVRLVSLPEPIAELESVLRRMHVNGIVGALSSPELIEVARGVGVPAVNVSNRVKKIVLPRVITDDAAAGRLGAEHLLERGLRDLAFAPFRHSAYSTERERGFHEAVEAGGARFHRIQEDPRRATTPERMMRSIGALPKPVGILACNDRCGRHVLESCLEVGLRVPDEVAVLGVDDDPVECELTPVPLSSVRLQGEQVGYEACRLLLRLIEGKAPPKLPILIPPVGVTVRRSSDVIAVSDAAVAQALRLIRERATESMTIASLLRDVPLSRRVLETRFRELLGRSPYAEVMRLRVQWAKQLLTETNLRVSEVAEQSGFGELRRLSVVFRAKTGLTPSEYRAQFRQ